MNRKQTAAHLQGIFTPVVTPFDRKGKLDEGMFRSNLERYAGIGLGGVVVSGSTGEAPYLTESERLRLVEMARQTVKPPELLIAGTGLESTAATLCLSQEAIERGADALLLLPPAYYKPVMSSEVLIRHYRALADKLKRPLIIYSIPQFSGINIEPDTIARLSRHPNIIGLKESSGDMKFLRAVLRIVPKTFRVLCGSPIRLLEAFRAGAAGGVLGPANFVPELCIGIYEAFSKRQYKRAEELQQKLIPLVQPISEPYGVPGIKAALSLLGYSGGFPRMPLQPVDAKGKRDILAALNAARASLDV
ncbi:MAG TPA: dihydrodipicolinate synthase family protein [Terriglobia bacterium]|nr:dihydrodipicolinate synthase family protein [Terriglobia bacterium]